MIKKISFILMVCVALTVLVVPVLADDMIITSQESNSSIPAVYNQIALLPGWNFVSTPKRLATGFNTASIFSGVDMGGHSAWMWDGSQGPGHWVALQANTPVQPLYGIWVYSTTSKVVDLNFDTTNPMFIPSPRSLYAGWNSVGFTGLYPASARNTFLSVQPDWVNSMGFNPVTQNYEPTMFNGDTSESTLLYPTRGYWLYMRNAGNLGAIGA